MEYYSAIKKNEILPFGTTWMDLEDIILSEISQRKTSTIWFHLYVESEKQNKTNEQNRNRPIDTGNKLMVAKEEGGGVGGRKNNQLAEEKKFF